MTREMKDIMRRSITNYHLVKNKTMEKRQNIKEIVWVILYMLCAFIGTILGNMYAL